MTVLKKSYRSGSSAVFAATATIWCLAFFCIANAQEISQGVGSAHPELLRPEVAAGVNPETAPPPVTLGPVADFAILADDGSLTLGNYSLSGVGANIGEHWRHL
jgi:hypothetical protein